MPSSQDLDGAPPTAFVGLGAMGFPIATRLAATRDLVVWDQSPSAREAIGALDRVVVASGLDALAAGPECVVMMLPDSAAVSAVVAALRPRMRPGTLLIDMGSSDPTVTRSIAGALEGEQIEFVDAPVSGGVAGAERARVTKALHDSGIPVTPSEANFILADFGSAERAQATDAKLRAQGIIVRRVAGYGLPNHLRITIARAEENDAFLAAVA